MSYIGNPPVVQSNRLITEDVVSVQGKTAFYPAGGYTPGQLDVVVNGSELGSGDYTATDGSLITLSIGCGVGDLVRITAYGTATLSNATPADGSVSTAKIAPGAVTLDKMTVPNSFGFRNRIINGDMRIDQRNAGASVTNNLVYTVDRWQWYYTSGSGHAIQQNTDAPAGFTNSLKVTVGTGASPSATQQNIVWQPIEGYNVADLGFGAAGAATITFSFWVKSSLTGTFNVWFHNSDDTRSYVSTYTVISANTWEQKTVTIVGDTSGTWLKTNGRGFIVGFSLGCGSNFNATANTWSAADYKSTSGATSVVGTSGATFYITGAQLEAGSVASPFERRDYGRELMMCQRYYEVITTSNAVFGFPAYCASPSIARGAIQFKVTKRATPTPVLMSTLAATNINCIPGNFNPTSTSFYADVNSVGFDLTIGTNSFINGQGCAIGITGTGLTISSEL